MYALMVIGIITDIICAVLGVTKNLNFGFLAIFFIGDLEKLKPYVSLICYNRILAAFVIFTSLSGSFLVFSNNYINGWFLLAVGLVSLMVSKMDRDNNNNEKIQQS